MSDTTAEGSGQCCRARPCTHRVAAHALHSAVVESEKLGGAGATAPGTSPADPAKCCWLCGGVGMREQPTLRFSLQVFAARLGVGFAFGTAHKTHCPFGRSSHLNSFRARNSPPAGPFGTELRSDNVALCAIPPLH